MNTIEEAIFDLASGKSIIVMDDEDRENEGDLISSSELCTADMVNFMSTHGKGLICVAITESRAKELELEEMVKSNSALHNTKFTVSVDYVHGTSTGISAMDRAATIRALANYHTKPDDLGRPGHIFPLIAVNGGVLRRSGHTEATTDLMELAGLKPTGVLCEIINEDGTMARYDDIKIFAEKFNLKIITIKDLIKYRLNRETLIEKTSEIKVNSIYGDFNLMTFRSKIDHTEHIVLVKGSWNDDETILVRAHSENLSNNILYTLKSENESELRRALKIITEEGKGILLFINKTDNINPLSHNINEILEKGTENKSYELFELMKKNNDPRDFGIGAQILKFLNVKKINLITNSPKKRIGLSSYNIEIIGVNPF